MTDRAIQVRLLARAATAFALLLGAFHASCYLGNVCDDAVISFRSVQNHELGHGLVFNPGERLETFTNLGFVGLLVLLRAVGIEMFAAATAIGYGAAVGSLAALWWLARELDLGARAFAPMLFVAASPTLMGQAGSGLETTLTALWVTLGSARCLCECRPRADGRPRRHGLGMLLLALAVLARPDALLVLGGWLVLKPLLLPAPARRSALAGDLVTAAVAVGAQFAFRLGYYGDPLPNPVYAKVGLGDPTVLAAGVRYLRDWVQGDFGLPILVAGLLLAVLGDGRVRALAVLGAGWCAYVVVSGGDHMPYARFLAPLLPLFAVLLTAAFAPRFAGGRWLSVCGVAFALALAAAPAGQALSRGNVPARNMAHESWRREAGAFFAAEAAQKGSLSVAVGAIGYLGYFGGERVRIVDVLGLADAAIARHGQRDATLPAGHQVGDGAHVLAQAPDVIVLGTSTPGDLWQQGDAAELLAQVRELGPEAFARARGHRFLVSERQLLADPQLFAHYAARKVTLPSGRTLQFLQRQ